ncbi:MAG: biopolymer transporter ExbD [Terrimicrobiaceae bacterium]|nr:biopolymer transporter ExbD [Terrimicrobiaceae bacterium]
MRFYTRKRRTPTINIVSLIDILVILLIFFIATSTFKKAQPQLEIHLPDSKTATAAATAKTEPLVLRVKTADQITLDDKPVALASLAAALQAARAKAPARPVAMQADRQAPFGVVVQVLDALKSAGIKNIPAFTQPEPPPGKPGA